jgi:hypothetical protein
MMPNRTRPLSAAAASYMTARGSTVRPHEGKRAAGHIFATGKPEAEPHSAE